MQSLISLRLFPVLPALVLAGTWGCSSRYGQRPYDPAVGVKTEMVSESDAIHTLNYVGAVEDLSSVALSFPVVGTIERIYVSEGQRVARGQLLTRVDPASAQNLFDAAGSALEQAKDAYDRLKSIHDNGSLPEIQMVEMETKLRQAQSTYNITKKNLDDCSLYAPIQGVVGRKMAEAGEYAVIGKTVLTIMDISSVRIRFSVPESEISAIPAGSASVIRVAALGDKVFHGKGLEKNVVANPVSRSYPVSITLSNPGQELLPGMVCQVSISMGGGPRGIVIPVGLVRNSAGGQKYVWGVDKGRAIRIPITTGEAKGNGVAVLSGLSPGDSIITEGYQKVSEGVKISGK